MRNIKLTIEYNGTNYHGWQIQPNAITIQEVIQNALATLTKAQTQIIGAGRTDAGSTRRRSGCQFFHRFYAIPKFHPESVERAPA